MNTIKLSDLKEEQIETLKAFIESGASKEQAKEYGLGLYNNIDVSKINDLNLSAQQMREIRLGEQDGLNTDLYRNLNVEEMFEIRYGMTCAKQDNRDITKYLDFSSEQLKAINDAYGAGLNVEQIDLAADKTYSPDVMKHLFDLIKSGQIKSKEEISTNLSIDENNNLDTLDNSNEQFVDETTKEDISSNEEEQADISLDEAIKEASNEVKQEPNDFDLGDLADYFDIG